MDLKQFLSVAANSTFWQQRQTLCFTSNEYPAAFFGALFGHLQGSNLLVSGLQRVDIVGRDKREVYGLLSQSMLGAQSFFLLGNISDERESKAAAAFKQYACSYQGPHSLAFFIATADLPPQSQATVVQLPAMLDQHEFILLARWLGHVDIERKAGIFEPLFYARKLLLNLCIALIDYVALGSLKHKDAFTAYLQALYVPEASLQQLAECFFAKREKDFFVLWNKVHQEYPPIFWVLFWTEQLWRGLHVAQFMQQKQFVLAKKMSFRLPYSFINKDWQRVQVNELVRGYEFLYQIDYAIKTGSTFCSQDLFFAHYFAGVFAKEGGV